jgi:hypothetical protein
MLGAHRVVEHDLGGAQEREAVGGEEVDAPAQGGEDDVGHRAGQETCARVSKNVRGWLRQYHAAPAGGRSELQLGCFARTFWSLAHAP